jgi:ferredoxin-type protein NapH
VTKTKVIRLGVAALVAFVVASGALGRLYYSGLCSVEVWVFSVTDAVGPLLRAAGVWRLPIDLACPLGFLERSLAAGELLPQWPSVLLVVGVIILLGRVFCAWMCPSVLLRRVLGDKGQPLSKPGIEVKGINWGSYSSYAVLGGVLVASFAFHFPVFCLVCPIGLFFGAVYAGMRLFSLDSPGLELIIFPAMLVLELWVLRDWCTAICPLGALYSLAGNLNRFLRPVVNKEKCFTSQGINCGACKRVCPEGIDLAKPAAFTPHSCTKCLRCFERCPKGAVDIHLWA